MARLQKLNATTLKREELLRQEAHFQGKAFLTATKFKSYSIRELNPLTEKLVELGFYENEVITIAKLFALFPDKEISELERISSSDVFEQINFHSKDYGKCAFHADGSLTISRCIHFNPKDNEVELVDSFHTGLPSGLEEFRPLWERLLTGPHGTDS